MMKQLNQKNPCLGLESIQGSAKAKEEPGMVFLHAVSKATAGERLSWSSQEVGPGSCHLQVSSLMWTNDQGNAKAWPNWQRHAPSCHRIIE